MTIRNYILALLFFFILGGFFLGFSGSVDDAHITFWAAQALGTQGQLLNYNFERVEQSSALFQVVILALLYLLSGISVVTLGHASTMAVSAAALYLTGKMAQSILPPSSNASLLLLASSPFFLYWSFSGMEGPWLALLLLLLLSNADRWLRQQTGLYTLFLVSLVSQMTRPEMPLVLLVFALILFPIRYLFAMYAWHWQAICKFFLMQVMCAIFITAWRWWYFNDLFPQPVSAKTGEQLLVSLLHGLQYVKETWLDMRLLTSVVFILLGAWLTIRGAQNNPLLLLLLILLSVYVAFVIASGGDWMAAGRFWVPVMPLASVLMAFALYEVFSKPRFRGAMLSILLAANVAYLWRGTAIDFNGVPLWKHSKLEAADKAKDYSFFERHAREHLHDIPTLAFIRPLIDELLSLRKAQGNLAPVQFMGGQMGMVPFYLASDARSRIRFTDRNGIVERTLTTCPVAQKLPRSRNGIGTGYAWIIEHRAQLEVECQFVMPDIVFDIETGWNRHNVLALQAAGYVFVYRQRGHIFSESPSEWLPLRKIAAGQFIAVSHATWEQLGRPVPLERNF